LAVVTRERRRRAAGGGVLRLPVDADVVDGRAQHHHPPSLHVSVALIGVSGLRCSRMVVLSAPAGGILLDLSMYVLTRGYAWGRRPLLDELDRLSLPRNLLAPLALSTRARSAVGLLQFGGGRCIVRA
jgi:hypothetical protein